MDPLALEDLAASVKLKGIIQPILFRADADRLAANASVIALQEALAIYLNPPEAAEGEAPPSNDLA